MYLYRGVAYAKQISVLYLVFSLEQLDLDIRLQCERIDSFSGES
jgi:hypothetical protein